MRNFSITAMMLAGTIFIQSCGDVTVPIKEMSAAKEQISKSNSINASKYAPDEMNEANDLLMESQKQVSEGNSEEARKKAVKSEETAKAAYEKSAPMAAKEAIDSANSALYDAEKAKAPSLAAEEYSQADNLLSSAKYLYDAGKFQEAFQKANEAKLSAIYAKETALANKSSSGSSSVYSGKSKPSLKSKDYTIHIVSGKKNPKETLANLARKYYKDMYKWVAIYNANKDVIEDPNKIYPGMKLRIPKKNVVKKFMYGNYNNVIIKDSGSDDPDDIEEDMNLEKKY